MGADILRLWVAATDYRGEVSFSDEIFKRTADSYRRIRNTARFLLSNLAGFDPARDALETGDMLCLDRWALDQAARVQEELLAAYADYQFHHVYQRLHNFCVNEMGGFYLDIIKDRLYTTPAESRARRSAQTALYHIVEALVRWIAPILSFTADEIWEYLPGDRPDSVFIVEWYPLATSDDTGSLDHAEWSRVIAARDALNRELEVQRNEGALKGGLDAGVTLYCDDELAALLGRLGAELRFVMITSEATVASLDEAPAEAADTAVPGLKLLVTRCYHPKCERCYLRCADVGQHAGHETICGRCVDNVEGDGEQREIA
jgi:isoleucyl-tRNA synthetase